MTSLRLPYFSTWMSDYSFGRILVDAGQAPTYAGYGVLAKYFGANYAVAERVIHMWPVVILTPVATYFLLKEYTRNNKAIFAGVVVYSFNTYMLTLETGHLTLAGAYAITPLVFLFFKRSIERMSIAYAALAGIALFICSSYEPRAGYIVGFGLFLYYCYDLVTDTKFRRSKIKALISKSVFAALPMIFFGLLSAFWLIGLKYAGTGGSGDLLDRQLFGAEFFNISEALALFHPYWNGSEPIPFVTHSIPWFFWVLPIMVAAGLYLGRKRKDVLFYGLIGLVGLFLTKEVAQPFGNIYAWLFQNFPGFQAYREASKFYALIALAYAVLAAIFIDEVYKSGRFQKRTKYLPHAIFGILTISVLVNIVPLITGTIGTTFVARQVPADYVTFNNFISKQSDFSRVLWVPIDSRWSIYTSNHPKVGAVRIAQGEFANFIDSSKTQPNVPTREQIVDLFTKPYAQSLFSRASIKYVVIPPRDQANDDDFYQDYGQSRQYFIDAVNQDKAFKKINIGTKDMLVYENTDFTPYVSSQLSLNSIQNISAFTSTYDFTKNTLRSAFDFITGGATLSNGVSVTDPFSSLTPSMLSQGGIFSSVALNKKLPLSIFVNAQKFDASYKVVGNNISFTTSPYGEIKVNGTVESTKANATQNVSVPIDQSNGTYYVSLPTGLSPINADGNLHDIGGLSTSFDVDKSTDVNLLPSAESKAGLFSGKVSDCDDFDNKPQISEQIISDTLEGNDPVIELNATSHDACAASDPLKVTNSLDYLLQFDYRVISGQQAGYEIVYNDPDNTHIQKQLITSDNEWRTAFIEMNPPAGATNAIIKMLAYPNERNPKLGTMRYSKISVSELRRIQTISIQTNTEPIYQASEGSSKVTITYPTESAANNLIDNPSLENGLWQKSVGDCSAYDNNAKISMKLDDSDASNGHKSLNLFATRHIACTGPNTTSVVGGKSYLFSFDYKSTTSNGSGYFVSFDDPAKTIYSGRLDYSTSGWHTFDKVLFAPPGASHINITVYGYPDSLGQKVEENSYDNLGLFEVPDIQNEYYVAQTSVSNVAKPKNITVQQEGQTRRIIHVTRATGAFYLVMSELYDKNWRLDIGNQANKSFIANNLPNGNISAIPSDLHYDVNDFENGWYIDPSKLCGISNACTKNTDGSYDIDFVAEFTPQRYMNVGIIISSTTLAALLTGLAYAGTRTYLHRRDLRRNGGEPVPAPGPKEVADRVVKKAKRVVRL